MSDSSNKFLPSEDQLGPVKPFAEALDAAEKLGQDAVLVGAMTGFKVEGTVPPHAAKESARVEAVVVEKAPAGGMARRRQSARHPPVPVLLGGRPNTDPGIASAAREAAARPQTKPGLGEPAAALVAKTEAEPELPIASMLAPPDPSQEVVETLPPDAEVPEVGSVDVLESEPVVLTGGRTDRDHYPNPLAEPTPEAFQLAQQGFEREAKTFEHNKLRMAREEAKTLDPKSERYLQLAEQWLDLGVRILNDQASADRDKPRVEARKALRLAEAERAEAEALERGRRAPRRRLLVLAGALFLVAAGGLGAYFYRNADVSSGVPSAMPGVTGVVPEARPAASTAESASTTAPAAPSMTASGTPAPSESARSTSPSARPSAVHSAAPAATPSVPGSSKPSVPNTAGPATGSSGSFGAWKGND